MGGGGVEVGLEHKVHVYHIDVCKWLLMLSYRFTGEHEDYFLHTFAIGKDRVKHLSYIMYGVSPLTCP